MKAADPDRAAQTRRNRSSGGRKAAEAKKRRWQDMAEQERAQAFRTALAGGPAVDAGVTRGTERGDYNVSELIARIRARERASADQPGQPTADARPSAPGT